MPFGHDAIGSGGVIADFIGSSTALDEDNGKTAPTRPKGPTPGTELAEEDLSAESR